MEKTYKVLYRKNEKKRTCQIKKACKFCKYTYVLNTQNPKRIDWILLPGWVGGTSTIYVMGGFD